MTKYACNEYIHTVNGERWKNAPLICAVNMLTRLLLATWLENLINFNRANKTAESTELSLRCSYFWDVVLCHCMIGTESFETAYCFCHQGLIGYWTLEDKSTTLPWNVRHPSLKSHIPEEQAHQQRLSESLKTCMFKFTWIKRVKKTTFLLCLKFMFHTCKISCTSAK